MLRLVMRGELGAANVVAAEPADAEAIARVHVRGWQEAYRGLMSEAFLQGLRAETRAEQWRAWLALPGRRIVVAKVQESVVGFCDSGPCRDPDAAAATQEIYALYVEPSHWSKGIGGSLLQRALSDAVDEDASVVALWVLEQNPRARAFYEHRGFEADGRSKFERVGGELLSELRYRLVLGR